MRRRKRGPSSRDLRTAIRRRIADFDLFALLDLLEFMGYESEEIVFRGHATQVSPPALLHDIEFHTSPGERVVISINFGLLAADSPLPSYFLHVLEQTDVDEDLYIQFLDYFNHQLIRNYIMSRAPERELTVYPDWSRTKSCYLAMSGLKSTATLHWMFVSVFPELGVVVEKARLNEDLTVDTIQIGPPYVLGSAAVLGSRSRVTVLGFDVTLFSEEEFISTGRAWAREIEDRLSHTIFAVLADAEIELRVFLTITSQRGGAKLGPESYLGYDKIPGAEDQARRICLFSGEVPRR